MLRRLVWLLLLSLVCGPVLALGLGQIEVRSKHGEPLLAEIPIVSSDPSELERLQARLASPETFRRVGLQPPAGLVSDLQFAVALDPQGRPVIRITTVVPVQEPTLTFLLEVDWGQGRLVREYSALVDSPQTVAAPVQPPITAPEAAPSGAIVRPAETAAAESAPQAAPSPETAAATPETPAPAPGPAPVPAQAPAAVAMGAGEALAPVRSGQTLSEIAAGLGAQSGHSLNQTMVALLRANPEAFIRGNINLLREGAVLRVPDAGDWSAESAREATAIVREQVAQWRDARSPVPQPVEAEAPSAAAATAGVRSRDARLEIVPPTSGGAAQAGTRSGIAAGGEGDMLRQQELTQARETIAAQGAEVDELKARIAELEQLQTQQAQLIALKDSELAAAQQRLAERNQQPAPALATTAQATQPDAATGAPLPWLWIGLGLVLLAALAWWLASRRSAAAEQSSRSFLSGKLAPAKPAPAKFTPANSTPAEPASVELPSATPASTRAVPAASFAAVAGVPLASAGDAAVPGNVVERDAGRLGPAAAIAASGWPNAPGEPVPPAETPPPWHAADDGAVQADAIAPLNPAPAGQERLELARAYIDLGDVDTARTLLQEVADTGDAGSRGEAARLLRELV